MSDIELHPVQTPNARYGAPRAQLSSLVTLAAYEVYCHMYGPQDAMIKNGCRGGFSTGEVIAFLYARSFPKAEWHQRVEEAFNGMVAL